MSKTLTEPDKVPYPWAKKVKPTHTEHIVEKLHPDLDKVLAKVSEAAKEGDPRSINQFLAYFPAPAASTLITVPGLDHAVTLKDKGDAIIAAVGEGTCSIEAAKAVFGLLESFARISLADDHERRLLAIEEGRLPPLPVIPAIEGTAVTITAEDLL